LIISLIKPQNFDWAVFGTIEKVETEGGRSLHEIDEEANYFSPERVRYMKKMSRWAAFWAILTFLGHFLLWPFPMYGAKMTFSKSVSAKELLFLLLHQG
jgi:hypothetical protein